MEELHLFTHSLSLVFSVPCSLSSFPVLLCFLSYVFWTGCWHLTYCALILPSILPYLHDGAQVLCWGFLTHTFWGLFPIQNSSMSCCHITSQIHTRFSCCHFRPLAISPHSISLNWLQNITYRMQMCWVNGLLLFSKHAICILNSALVLFPPSDSLCTVMQVVHCTRAPGWSCRRGWNPSSALLSRVSPGGGLCLPKVKGALL